MQKTGRSWDFSRTPRIPRLGRRKGFVFEPQAFVMIRRARGFFGGRIRTYKKFFGQVLIAKNIENFSGESSIDPPGPFLQECFFLFFMI
jgi:hypothetical protein